jgi:thymidylate synthase (FAD)
MKFMKPKYIVVPFDAVDMLQEIERAGRTCYKSESKITLNSAEGFVRRLLKSGHESVLEHKSITVRFIIDRGTSHCFVRHRIAAFSQESTQYCNYAKERHGRNVSFIIPPWCEHIHEGEYVGLADVVKVCGSLDEEESMWVQAMMMAEAAYIGLIEKGWKAQQARAVLPNSLKTELVMTCNLRMWRHIFLQRITTMADQAQTREVLTPLCRGLQKVLPSVFGDIRALEWNYVLRFP